MTGIGQRRGDCSNCILLGIDYNNAYPFGSISVNTPYIRMTFHDLPKNACSNNV